MAKTKRPRFRVNDRITLAPHTPLIPAYGDKPFVSRDFVLRVSSVVGKGTLRDPWGVNVTDDAGHFWHLQPGDIVPAETELGRSHATKKTGAQLDREIAASLSRASTVLEVGDKVRHRHSRPGTFGYDEGVIVGLTPRQQRARVRWRRAQQSYDEALEDLEQVPAVR